jgi:hypothetical protein
MTNTVTHITGKLSDAQIVKLFEGVASEFQIDGVTVNYGQISTKIDEIKGVIGRQRSFIISNAKCDIENGKLSVQYARGLTTISHQNGSQFSVRNASPYFDEFIITPTSSNNGIPARPTINEIAKLESIIRQHIILRIPEEVDCVGSSAVDLLQKELAAITEIHHKLLTDAIDLRQANTKEQESKLAELAEREKQSLAKIEAQKLKTEQDLAEQKASLEAKQKELDDRNHMHVRRALREQITADIQTRVSGALLSSRSRLLGRGVFGLSLVCAVASGVFSYWSYEAFAQVLAQPAAALNGREWALLVLGMRATIAVIATVGFLVYALAWLRRTYDEDVKLNNDLQRYALDLNRASWIIETVMEMSAKEGQSPPPKWVDGVTHGMFQSPGQADEGVTPLEALGTLLNVTARAEVGPGGTKLEFDGKNLRKIARSGESPA